MASELGVQTIQHTNGTDALTVGSDGVVTAAQYIKQTNIVSFRATSSSNISGQSSGIIIWGSVSDANRGLHNIGSHYNTSTGKFICPVDGVYHFSFQCFTNGTSSLDVDIYKNTFQVHRSSANDGNASSYESIHGSINIQCSANDEIYMDVVSGALHTNTKYSYFGGYLIG